MKEKTFLSAMDKICKSGYMNLMGKSILENAVDHGFFEAFSNMRHTIREHNPAMDDDLEMLELGQRVALIHSEVSEMLEALRAGQPKSINLDGFKENLDNEAFKQKYAKEVKGSLGEEIADVIIRTLELAQITGVDADENIRLKMRYNSLRPKMHGGKKF